MTLTNHLLAGAALAKFLPMPIAIPLAFASHFALDALPHFGFRSIDERMRHITLFRAVIVLDGIAAAILAWWLLRSGHAAWMFVGLVAYTPDMLWIYRFSVEEKFGRVEPTKGNRFIQFHRNIQKYERMWGIAVEIVFSVLFFKLIN